MSPATAPHKVFAAGPTLPSGAVDGATGPRGDSPANEIRRLHSEIVGALRVSVGKAIRIGELLTEQKARLPHGAFEAWIKRECGFTSRTGRRYMRLFDRRDLIAGATDLSAAYSLLTDGGKSDTVSDFNPLSSAERADLDRCEAKIRDGLAALASIRETGNEGAFRNALESLRRALPSDMGWLPANLAFRWRLPPAAAATKGEGDPPGFIPPKGHALTAVFRGAMVNVHPATGGGFHIHAIKWSPDSEGSGESASMRYPVRPEAVELAAKACLGLSKDEAMPGGAFWWHDGCEATEECSPLGDAAEHRAERLHHSFPNKYPPPEGTACTCWYCKRRAEGGAK